MQCHINYCLLLLLCLGSLACEQEKQQDEPSVQEITSSGPLSNADIIRSPISADQPVDSSSAARMEFDERVFDFGVVTAGEIVEHTFSFRNTGQVPLLIHDARSTCGCTVPSYPESPIEPGAEGEITVRFDTENKVQKQKKPITLLANTYPNRTELLLVGVVRKPVQ